MCAVQKGVVIISLLIHTEMSTFGRKCVKYTQVSTVLKQGEQREFVNDLKIITRD